MTTVNAPAPKNTLATVSMIIGVLAILIGVFAQGNLFAAFLGLAAIVLGVIALKQAKAPGGTGKGMAMAGIVTGALAIIVVLLFIFVLGPMIAGVFSDIEQAITP